MLKNIVKFVIVVIVSSLVLATAHSAALAAEWGSIKGRIVVDGEAPKPVPLVVAKDQFCIDKKPTNDAIVVGKDKGLANAFVYVRLPLGGKIEVNPEYDAALKKPVSLDNNGCLFHPRALAIRVGQELEIKNSDPVGHNTNVSIFGFNQIVPSNETLKVKASKDQALPSEVQCNIHPWMKAYVLCQNHPYMAVTGDDGKFEIKGIPVGEHNFQFWQEAGGYLKDSKFKSGTTDKKGQAKIKIAAGGTVDIGDLMVKGSSLKTSP